MEIQNYEIIWANVYGHFSLIVSIIIFRKWNAGKVKVEEDQHLHSTKNKGKWKVKESLENLREKAGSGEGASNQ